MYAVRDAVGRAADFDKLPTPWLNGLKLHAATLPLAEFAAVVGNLRAARFGRDSAWRNMATFGALDELRHTQIGRPVLGKVVAHDPAYAQDLVDKWFWRSWLLFAVVTGISMDYLTPLSARTQSFKEFVEEWVADQYLRSLEDLGLARPWYWDTFVESLEHYHHMVYASAYTYRATVWFDLVLPSPEERAWLAQKYPASWPAFAPIWERLSERWRASDPGNDFAVHGTAIVTFCDLCQLVLSNGTPKRNTANVLDHGGRRYIFCSQPCRWIFAQEPERYARHRDLVKRVLAGEAPGNLVAMLQQYFGLRYETWGKDAFGGTYAWLPRTRR